MLLMLNSISHLLKDVHLNINNDQKICRLNYALERLLPLLLPGLKSISLTGNTFVRLHAQRPFAQMVKQARGLWVHYQDYDGAVINILLKWLRETRKDGQPKVLVFQEWKQQEVEHFIWKVYEVCIDS